MRRISRPKRSFDTWQIIYIDLMTNVMIFFVVLWAINTRQAKNASEAHLGNETVKMVSLPGDVLFPSAKSDLGAEGRDVLAKLFSGDQQVLSFDTGPLLKRLLVIHGHTDSDGGKDQNLQLGFERALSAYKEILRYGGALADHVVLCTHADNSAVVEVPAASAGLGEAELAAVRAAKAKNRRITIEDKLVSKAK